MKFEKPSLSIADQIALLIRRGMAVPDRAKAEHYLRHVSYYRLRAYWLPFERPSPVDGDHLFVEGTTFDDVLALYVFDRRLRLLAMDAVERIEVSLRGNWAHCLALKYGPHGYFRSDLYDDPEHYAKALAGLSEEIDRSRDTFIEHYRRKYDDPHMPPIWMTAEVISLGQLSKWLSGLKHRADRQAIAKVYGLDEKVLVSIAHHLAHIRNICAHHGRLWNKQFTVTMKLPASPAALKLAMNPAAPRKLYNTLAAVGYLLGIIAPGTTWRKHVADLMSEYPLADPSAMGFPENWRARPAWR
jgi:abortive infection bacteriophage resistance protein